MQTCVVVHVSNWAKCIMRDQCVFSGTLQTHIIQSKSTPAFCSLITFNLLCIHLFEQSFNFFLPDATFSTFRINDVYMYFTLNLHLNLSPVFFSPITLFFSVSELISNLLYFRLLADDENLQRLDVRIFFIYYGFMYPICF